MKNNVTLGLIVVLVTGCAPDVKSTRFQEFPSRPQGAPVQVYQSKSPECDFEEVGIVRSRQRNKFISMNEVMNSLRAESRKLGGDAIIGLTETNPISYENESVVDRDPVLSGTVIKFIDSQCKQ